MIKYLLYENIDKDYKIADGFFENWLNRPNKLTHIKIMENSYKTIIAVDVNKKLIIGFLTIISDGVLSAYISLLEVIPEYRNKNIGKNLFLKAMEETKNFYMIDLCCDDNMISFYEKFNMFKSNSMSIRNYFNQQSETKNK